MKNIIVVTGGAGFVGTNLISFLLKNSKCKILSIDNYSSGSKRNHIKDKKIKQAQCKFMGSKFTERLERALD